MNRVPAVQTESSDHLKYFTTRKGRKSYNRPLIIQCGADCGKHRAATGSGLNQTLGT